MPSITNLSSYTVSRAIGYMRGMLDEVAPGKLDQLPLAMYLNLAQMEVALLINSNRLPDYGETLTIKNSASGAGEVELSVSGTDPTYGYANITVDASTAKIRIDNVERVTYIPAEGSPIACKEVSPVDFEGLTGNTLKAGGVYYYYFGGVVYVKNLVSGITQESHWGSLKVYYNRYPAKLSADNADRLGDTLDVRDGYVRAVLDKAILFALEELQVQMPEEASESVNSLIEQISQAQTAETSFINTVMS